MTEINLAPDAAAMVKRLYGEATSTMRDAAAMIEKLAQGLTRV